MVNLDDVLPHKTIAGESPVREAGVLLACEYNENQNRAPLEQAKEESFTDRTYVCWTSLETDMQKLTTVNQEQRFLVEVGKTQHRRLA